jgi:FKBP-type peptidyl-prolyl cis-trans isomerase
MKFPKKERIIALFFAVLFLGTSSTVAVLAIINSVQSSKDNGAATSQQPTKKGENVLQGTQLAGFTPMPSVAELQTIDTVPGTGQEVKPGEEVTVDYTGAVATTGTIFQSSLDFGQPVSFNLSGVIKGWTEGIPGMKVGGTRRLLIPAAKAYAGSPPAGSGIPVNADLVFDVTLRKIGK